MAKPIELSLVANANDLLKTTDSVDDALDKNLKSLYDLAKGSDKMSGEVKEDFKDVVRAVDKFGQSLDDAKDDAKGFANVVDKEADRASSSFQTSGNKIKTSSKETFEEVKNEAKQNLGETLSSFDGTASGIASGIQGTFGGLAASLGPIGIGIATAGAVGLGAITKSLEDQQAAADELKEHLISAYTEATNAGRGYLDEAQIIAVAQSVYLDPDKFKAAQKSAEAIGVSVQTYIRAQAGDQDALNQSIATGAKTIKDRDDAIAASGTNRANNIVQGVTAEDEATQRVIRTLEQQKLTQDALANGAANYLDSIHGVESDAAKARAAVAQIPSEHTVKVNLDDVAAGNALTRLAQRNINIPVNFITPGGKKIPY